MIAVGTIAILFFSVCFLMLAFITMATAGIYFPKITIFIDLITTKINFQKPRNEKLIQLPLKVIVAFLVLR